ncbi:MAG: hypothetical protein JSS24_12830 [Proteobacteria bacterium]|nr:hypothetical protein [Pseudomonadota bacterium]
MMNKRSEPGLVNSEERRQSVQVIARAATVRAVSAIGIAYDLEEHTEGISAVGTAFTDPLGRVVALSIPVPTTRFKRLKPELAAKLLQARTRIIEALDSGSAA